MDARKALDRAQHHRRFPSRDAQSRRGAVSEIEDPAPLSALHTIKPRAQGVECRAVSLYGGRRDVRREIGRASCRERVCQYVLISVVAESLKKKRHKTQHLIQAVSNQKKL